jgi:hypothetical protein
MIGSLLSTIVETLLVSAGQAVLRIFAGEQVAELVTAVVGLSCIVLGFVMFYHAH